MNIYDWLQILFYLTVLFALVKPLGGYMARVYQNERVVLDPILDPVERFIYRASGVDSKTEMNWKTYAVAMLLFNAIGLLAVYFLQRVQFLLPLNPQGFGAVTPDSSWNTATSFVTNTNWQGYGGETTMSYLTQMLAMTVQNFVSAATGMAVLVALIRGIVRHTTKEIGNFWVDLTRSALYILVPLALALSLALVSQGVVQTFNESQTAVSLQSGEQTIAVGPAASQIAIKQLGTNGGGFFNTNSAHPLENATPFSNFLEMLALVLIPAALCYTYGKMIGDTRQGWSLLIAMTIVFVSLLGVTVWSEKTANPAIEALGVAGGNMEGKEVRFGIVNSALWATATTSVSNGAVNSMLDSYMPLGGLVPMWLMQLGEIIFGGVGSGLYGMLAFVIIAVFVAGLMVGRTPEYLGKKIEAYEMKMASLVILVPVIVTLVGTAIALMSEAGRATIFNPSAHGFSEVLYAFSSTAANNGSAFAGLGANNPFYNTALGLAMLIVRFWLAVPILAVAGSLANKKKTPVSNGTLPTHTPLFIGWLIGVIVIVGALSYLPALALGPIVEHLMIFK
ncbi:MAG: potassium-transporting ATPase subunit KdpA [Anaerolineae bacterium]|nr:potassium-transporting ATPase subunit KdpA [Anaerolineae bacterium]MBL8105615.1 potassium-transporting ATPase subunit KdpA [Anaerolineales bacterium]MCC7190643.1 potassium-transporting ATPase subunit KdpA [Anaerolineales bacterium]